MPGTRRLSPDDASNLPRIPTTPISYGEAQPLLEGLSGPAAPESFQGGAADRLPRRAGRHAGASQARHRVRADARARRARDDPRHVAAGREGRARRALRRLDLRDQRRHERLDDDDGGRAATSARSSIAAGGRSARSSSPAGTARSTGSSARPSTPSRSARTSSATPSPTPISTAPAATVRRRRRAAARRRARGHDPVGRRSAHRRAGLRHVAAATSARPIGRLGSGSDYTSFLDHLGVPSYEAGFTRPPAAGRTTPRTTTRSTWSTTSTPATSGMRGRRRSTACGAAARQRRHPAVPLLRLRRGRGSYVAELEQVQAETPGAAQVDLSPLTTRRRLGRGFDGLEARADELLAAGDTDSSRASRAITRINPALMRQERALIDESRPAGPPVVPPPDLCARPRDGLRRPVPAGHARRRRAGRRGDGADVPRPAARLPARRDAARREGA